MKTVVLALLALSTACTSPNLAIQASKPKLAPVSHDRRYPYRSSTFNTFVQESFKCCKLHDSDRFFQLMDKEFSTNSGSSVDDWIAKKKAAYESSNDKPKIARLIGEELHRLIKRSIRKFSLDRGFEFANVVSTGERQCFLQSVLIAGILQQIGLDAGVAMIWKNISGQTSNNGHAVCLLRFDKDQLIVIDASEPMAFPKHQGIFTYVESKGTYAFLLPNYNPDSTISSFAVNSDSTQITSADIEFLDIPFVRSQFDYYRGERAEGGILAKIPTQQGLDASRVFFERAKSECANNPLVLAMLARTYLKLGMKEKAAATFNQARPLYESYGWIPPGFGR